MTRQRRDRAKARSLTGGRDFSPAGVVERPVRSFAVPALGIFLAAASLRLIHVWQIRDTPFLTVLMGDSRGYDVWAQRLAAGDWWGNEVFYQAPLYPYFLGVLYALLGRDLFAVRLVQAVLGALSCVALGVAASRLISRTAGIVSGLMLAAYAPAIFFDGLIQKSILDVLFVCVALALIGEIVAADTKRRSWLLLGVTMGALSLTRENALVLVVCVGVWALRKGRSRAIAGRRAHGHKTWTPALLFSAGVVIVLLPIAVRNYTIGSGFYVTTSQFGSNLYIGNNPRADGSYVALRPGRGSPEYERLDATELAEHAVGRPLTPADVSNYWLQRTLAYVASDPGAWGALLARKARLVWSASEIIDTESLESHADYSPLLAALSSIWHFGVLLPFAVVGAVVVWPQRRHLWILYVLAAAYAVSVVLFFVVARYRYPLVPFLMIFAAAGLTRLRTVIDQAPRRRLIATGAAAVGMTAMAFWPHHTPDERRAITENNLGTALQEEGRLDEAAARYRRALALDAKYTPALNNLGTALRAAGRVDEAISAYEQALAKQPRAPSVHYNLANALMAQGKTGNAIAHFREVLKLDPQHTEAHNNLGLALEMEGRADEAIAAFRQALAIDERSAQAHSNLGNALASRGAARDALTHLQRAIELAPTNAGAYYDLGSLLLERGEFAPAAAALREAIRLNATDAAAHNNLGIALASQGQIDEAVKHWRQAVRLKPDFLDAQRNLELAQRNR